MKVIGLKVENFKRIQSVRIKPGDDNLVIVSGKNAQGKSSLIEAIWAVLQWSTLSKSTPKPIKHGEESAEVTVDLGKYKMSRKWTSAGKSYLVIKEAGVKGGAPISSPQKLLDGLTGDLCFDPLAFTRLSEKDQTATLLRMMGVDLSVLDALRSDVFDKRSDASRNLKRATGFFETLAEPPDDTPDKPIDVEALANQVIATSKANEEYAAARRDVGAYEKAIEAALARVEELKQSLANAVARVKELNLTLANLKTKSGSLEWRSLEKMEEQLSGAKSINDAVAAKRSRDEAEAEIDEIEQTVKAFTQELKNIDSEKRKMLSAANVPVDGLAVDPEKGTLAFGGVSLKQISSSEQLRVSAGIAMAQNPELRIMYIKDGSLLDKDSLSVLESLAKDRDYQVWVEVVDENAETGIIIEDGTVKGTV